MTTLAIIFAVLFCVTFAALGWVVWYLFSILAALFKGF